MSCHARPAIRAFTLVEVLVAVARMALLSGTIVIGSGMLGGSRLRAAAGLVVTAVRIGITRANATGRTVRVVFDLEGQHLGLEETTDRMLRVKENPKDSKQSEGASAGANPVNEIEKQSLEYADGIVKGPRAPRAKFTSIPFGTRDPSAGAGRELGAGVKYRQVQTEHDGKPRTAGRAYLYIWPGGGTERAVVQLQRAEDVVLSVLVSPLTGRARIERGKQDLQEPRREEDFGMREAEP